MHERCGSAQVVREAAREFPGQPRFVTALLFALACTVVGLPCAPAFGETQAVDASSAQLSAPVSAAPRTPQRRDPAAALARRLDLDAQQTAAVRRLLAKRQAEVRSLWTHGTVAAEDRVGVVKAINERTAARIRALLNEQQKKAYFQPKPDAGPDNGNRPSVEQWMSISRSQRPVAK